MKRGGIGNFAATFNIQGLAAGSYPITYRFLGDGGRFNAAADAAGMLVVRAAPAIVTSPVSQTVTAGNSITFSAAASGYPASTVQWQQSTNGTTYTNIAGATSTTYSISAAAVGQNGYRYRAVFTNSVGSATTANATLTVRYAPAVTISPVSQTVNAGQSVTFTAAATGNPTPTVQWQLSTNGGSSYSNINGATGTTLTLSSTTASQNGYRYRAVFTNSVGTATTSAAILTVLSAPVITTNPTNKTVTAGQTVTFTAAAAGNPTPTAAWQVSTDGGQTFTNIAGATSTTLSFTASTNQRGFRYRAVFSNSLGAAISAVAILTV